MRRSDLIPPALTRWLLRISNRATLRGDYRSWKEALAASSAYTTDLQVYAQFVAQIRAGKRTSGRVLSPLLAAIALSGQRARVLDFGGNLGHVYFDVARLADPIVDWWTVVDLPDVVALGTERFADGKLAFFTDLQPALARGAPNIVLFFHVLQYLELPFEHLSRILALAPPLVVLHEFPVAEHERFMVQHLLPELGSGTRPVRIFAEAQIRAAFADYELIEELTLPAWDRTLVDVRHVARLYRRRATAR